MFGNFSGRIEKNVFFLFRFGSNAAIRLAFNLINGNVNSSRVINMSDIADRVKKIVVEHLGVEDDKVVEGARRISSCTLNDLFIGTS